MNELPSAQPVRTPGPAILLKLPLLRTLPKPSAPGRFVPPSMSASMSTRRGIMAWKGADVEVVGQ